jgi:poly(3-hydroxybutyrate) depolymerase
MIYDAYQAYVDMLSPLRAFAETARTHLGRPIFEQCDPARKFAAACEVFLAGKVTHSRPPFRIERVVNGEGPNAVEVKVTEETTHVAPFATLLHFKKQGITGQPRVLIVAPMSGHFATLLRETVRTMLGDHDVYITDWHNARDVPLSAGRFGLDEYTQYVMDFLGIIGPGSHLMAICQPCVPALAAAAIMAEDRNPAQPRSITLMAGPIDCRISPTKVNELAVSKPLSWFEKNLISHVPFRHKGAFRRVYPGFLQLSAFMSMNPDRHSSAFKGLYQDLVDGETEKADVTRAFYEEYFAVLDMDAAFYLETIEHVFQEYALAKGKLKWRDRIVNPGAIRRTALLTVEGENDDICALGQTMAAHDLCSNIPPFLKSHHMQAGVGHYGVFSGRRWNRQIYPIVREMIYSTL